MLLAIQFLLFFFFECQPVSTRKLTIYNPGCFNPLPLSFHYCPVLGQSHYYRVLKMLHNTQHSIVHSASGHTWHIDPTTAVQLYNCAVAPSRSCGTQTSIMLSYSPHNSNPIAKKDITDQHSSHLILKSHQSFFLQLKVCLSKLFHLHKVYRSLIHCPILVSRLLMSFWLWLIHFMFLVIEVLSSDWKLG